MPLLIKGLGHSHAVRAYVSHADEVDVKPDAFTLPASGLFELTARVRPLRAFGRMDALVHLVDQQTRELVHALVITADVGLPCITRAFECEVPRGTSVQKKFSYQNRCVAAGSGCVAAWFSASLWLNLSFSTPSALQVLPPAALLPAHLPPAARAAAARRRRGSGRRGRGGRARHQRADGDPAGDRGGADIYQ